MAPHPTALGLAWTLGPGNGGLVEASGPSNSSLAGPPGLGNLKHKILSLSLEFSKIQKK